MYVMQVYYICRFYVKIVVTDVYCIWHILSIKQCVSDTIIYILMLAYILIKLDDLLDTQFEQCILTIAFRFKIE